jgi:hypothetical protein
MPRGKSGKWREDMPAIAEEVPAIEIPDDWEPGPELMARPVVKDWRRMGARLTGVLGDDIQTIPGLIVKLYIRGGWVLMDDGEVYQLGLRAYPGT